MTVVKLNNRGKNPGPGPRNDQGLTVKQEQFAQEVALGKTLVAAYHSAYDTSTMKEGSVRVAASREADKPHVNQRINELLEQRYDKSLMKDARRTRMFVFDGLMEVIGDKSTSPSAKIKALELLGKVDGVDLFKERSESEVTQHPSSSSLADELKSKLEEAVKQLEKKEE
jgi:hypothetical protein